MTYCTNCDDKVYENKIKWINGEPYCRECYEELQDELENPDLGDDGYHNLYGEDD